MPNEALITQIENILSQVVNIGGQQEITSVVTNLEVVDASPTGLTGFITIVDERDGDTILAKTVPGLEYAATDLVNVLFINGAEPVAFQQASQSSGSNSLWKVVPSTSTDIFYNSGDVGIGKAVAPDAKLEILDASQAQLRLTHTEDTDFVDFQIDTNADLTVTPSGTGQVIFQPTTDSTDFFQVLDADGGAPVLNVDSTNERVGIGIAAPTAKSHIFASSGISDTRVESTDSASFAQTLMRANAASFIMRAYGTTEGGTSLGITRSDWGAFITSAASGMMFECVQDVPIVFGNNSLERMRIDSGGGNVAIGTTSTAAKLRVDNPSAAQPVLYLDQGDVSEEMIEFATTIGVGNAIEAVGAKTLTVTHFIKITIPGPLTRYIEVGTIA